MRNMTDKKILDDNHVKHVAKLAKLELSEEDVKLFLTQLTSILQFVDQLAKVDTNGIEPTSQITGLENVFRDDMVEPSLSQEEVLANTKRKHKGYFLVDAVLEQ
jgi:aspartyl-tRNA(Asn)/glutamyl-tRNA(Gln) amidotransferase subunit C